MLTMEFFTYIRIQISQMLQYKRKQLKTVIDPCKGWQTLVVISYMSMANKMKFRNAWLILTDFQPSVLFVSKIIGKVMNTIDSCYRNNSYQSNRKHLSEAFSALRNFIFSGHTEGLNYSTIDPIDECKLNTFSLKPYRSK